MNAKLKLIKNLLEKRSARRKEKLFVVEGPHLVEEAGERVKFFFYSENLPIVKKLEEQGSVGYKISAKQFAEISQVETPQGIMAAVRELRYSIDDLFTPFVPSEHLPLTKGEIKEGVFIFCLGVQDPGNLGTIIRSADAFGAAGVLLSKGTVDLYNPKVIRSTMGSLFHLPIVTVEDELKTIEQLKQKGVKIIATEASAKLTSFASDLQGPIAILIGNEGSGLAKEIRDQADESIRIPMSGKAESLNAGVAAAIVLYEALRQTNG